jgi:hypothetical protein
MRGIPLITLIPPPALPAFVPSSAELGTPEGRTVFSTTRPGLLRCLVVERRGSRLAHQSVLLAAEAVFHHVTPVFVRQPTQFSRLLE